MRKIRDTAIAACLLVLAGTVPARAIPITFDFEGVVSQVDLFGMAFSDVGVGDPFTGYLTYEPSTPPTTALPDRAFYDSAIVGFGLTFGGVSVDYDLADPMVNDRIGITDNDPVISDIFALLLSAGLPASETPFGPTMFGLQTTEIDLAFWDTSLSVFDSTVPLPSTFDFDDFTNSSFSLALKAPLDGGEVHITALPLSGLRPRVPSVPEPSTTALLAAGLVGAYVGRARRARQRGI